MTYVARLKENIRARGALCVGIDPHPGLLERWGLPDDVTGVERFARGVVEALGETVAAFKPQSAFFEVWGAAGVKVLEDTIRDAQAAGALVIVDAKRGDIGSTMTAYARAYLGDGPLAGDAVTLSPYLGFGSLEPAFELAEAQGKGVYVLARTSNPEGHTVQLAAGPDGRSVVQAIVDAALARNAVTGLDAIGLVIGGTHATVGADLAGFAGPILVPGIGAQGGTIAGVRALFGDSAAPILPSASREVLAAGPDPAALRAKAGLIRGGRV
ncbi:MAG: orotidine-5'-phosphate decarboxylase [Propionibacteriaceae bacterium]|jgi:orotidine-5'-phosphate decarboxylase|nr:orotidine-5'-phosphate decarboxylase [Propionibacteriaceae bacterium]